MRIYDLEFSIDELREFVNLIQNLRNKKENYICLLLYLSTQVLQDWYNDINKIFTSVIRKKGIRNLTDDEQNKVFEFTEQIVYIPIVKTLRTFLDEVINDYKYKTEENEKEHNELKKIIDKENFSKIEQIGFSLFRFSDEGSKTKTKWITDISNSDDWDVAAPTVLHWKQELKNLALHAHDARINLKLRCSQNNLRNIADGYKKNGRIEL